jgi:hypothetical protein
MGMPETLKWRAALLQGMAVLSGILGAFAIDAAWDVRQEREEAAAYLESLLVELEANPGSVEAEVEALAASVRLTDQFVVDVAASPTAAVTHDSIRAMWWAMNPLEVTPLRRAAFDDLTSGGLQAVQEAEIRRLILKYGQAMEFDRLREERAAAWYVTRMEPYIEMEGDIVGMASIYAGGWLGRTDLSYDFDVGSYVGNRRYGNLLASRAYRLSWVRDSKRQLLDALVELRTALVSR